MTIKKRFYSLLLKLTLHWKKRYTHTSIFWKIPIFLHFFERLYHANLSVTEIFLRLTFHLEAGLAHFKRSMSVIAHFHFFSFYISNHLFSFYICFIHTSNKSFVHLRKHEVVLLHTSNLYDFSLIYSILFILSINEFRIITCNI